MPTVRRLIDHLAWADGQVLGALRARPGAEALRLVAHLVGAEHVWISRIEGVAPRVAVWPQLDLDQCAELAAENHARLRSIALAADEEALARPVSYTTSDGRAFTSSLEEILVHVALHGQHHRGQVNAAIRAAGGAPASIDFIAWTRGAPAATRGP